MNVNSCFRGSVVRVLVGMYSCFYGRVVRVFVGIHSSIFVFLWEKILSHRFHRFHRSKTKT